MLAQQAFNIKCSLILHFTIKEMTHCDAATLKNRGENGDLRKPDFEDFEGQ